MSEADYRPKSVLQRWVMDLSYMQQSVLIAAVRAPDGMRKDHPVKVMLRWYRRCTLVSAFDGARFTDPISPGGGSFTGPFTDTHQLDMAIQHFDEIRDVYLRHVDEMPHHFQLHMMHAAQILGFKHDIPWIRDWWHKFYLMIVNDAHLHPESKEEMDLRLGDSEPAWRAREVVTAR